MRTSIGNYGARGRCPIGVGRAATGGPAGDSSEPPVVASAQHFVVPAAHCKRTAAKGCELSPDRLG